jgi:hypothetical protein
MRTLDQASWSSLAVSSGNVSSENGDRETSWSSVLAVTVSRGICACVSGTSDRKTKSVCPPADSTVTATCDPTAYLANRWAMAGHFMQLASWRDSKLRNCSSFSNRASKP